MTRVSVSSSPQMSLSGAGRLTMVVAMASHGAVGVGCTGVHALLPRLYEQVGTTHEVAVTVGQLR